MIAIALTVAVAIIANLTTRSGIAIGAATVAIAITLLGAYIGHRAVAFDKKSTLIRQFVMTLSARGTSFHGADLTDADFTEATLKNTDFKNAILIAQ